MIRFLVSLVVCIIGIFYSFFISSGSIPVFFDFPSIIIIGIFPFIYVCILFGFKDMVAAFSTALKKEEGKDKLILALTFFKKYEKIIWIMGFINTIICVIIALRNIDDIPAIGPNFSLALIPLLYCGIINLVIIIPFTLFIKKQLRY